MSQKNVASKRASKRAPKLPRIIKSPKFPKPEYDLIACPRCQGSGKIISERGQEIYR